MTRRRMLRECAKARDDPVAPSWVIRAFIAICAVLLGCGALGCAASATRSSSPARPADRSTRQQYAAWRTSFVEHAHADSLGYPDDHVVVLAEEEARRRARRRARTSARRSPILRRRATKDDVRARAADRPRHRRRRRRSQVQSGRTRPERGGVGRPDQADRRARRLRQHGERQLSVSRALSGRGRIVLTANDSAAQQFETVFPEFFVKAFSDDSADLDKNGKVSIWEAFSSRRARVCADGSRSAGSCDRAAAARRHRRRRRTRGRRLPGRTARWRRSPICSRSGRSCETGDSELTEPASTPRRSSKRSSRRCAARKPAMLPDEYETALEKVLLEIARIDRRVRTKS